MRDVVTYIMTQKVTATKNVNKSITREQIIGFEYIIAIQQISVINFCDAWYALCRGVHVPYTP